MSDSSRTGEARRRYAWPSAGMVALSLMILNVAAFFWAQWMVGGGVDSGIGLVVFMMYFNVPVLIVTIITAVVAVTKKKGTIPGAIALAASTGIVLLGVWGFVSTQML